MSTPSIVPEPVQVGFSIDLSTVIGEHYRQTGEDDWSSTPETLADRVATLIAEKVYREIKNGEGFYRHDEINSAIDKALDDRVAAVLERAVTPTDGFGNPKGEPTTLAEMIDKRMENWLREVKSTDSMSRNRKTNLQAIIDDRVSTALTKDIGKAIEEAKAEAVVQIHAAAATVFTDAIARAGGVR